MGNSSSGFQTPPRRYLRELRRETNMRFRFIFTSLRRQKSCLKKVTASVDVRKQELSSISLKKHLINNPEFLDNFVKDYMSHDRIRAWLRVSTDDMLERVQEEGREMNDEKKHDPLFNSEVADRYLRQRKLLVITRNHFLFPFRYRREELVNLMEKPPSAFPEVDTYTFPFTEINPEDINTIFIYMLTQLLGKYAFPKTEMCYFLTTLNENYFNIEYHNYNHALSHAQSMFWMLKSNPGIFNELEVKSLMVASIAHDVGYFGMDEKYVNTVTNGLDRMYYSPILKHHHIQICFLILQDINCNIFCDLEEEDYKQVLRDIEHAILSTDTCRYNMQVETVRQYIGAKLDMKDKDVKDAVKSIMMMACEFCGAWKRWPEHKIDIWCLYKEYFNQGDREMNFEMDSLPRMNRINADNIPEFQTDIFQTVIFPIFQLIEKIFPNLKNITIAAKENYNLWKSF